MVSKSETVAVNDLIKLMKSSGGCKENMEMVHSGILSILNALHRWPREGLEVDTSSD